jgi:Zn-finger nucleic acid-binding protein
MHSPAHPDVQMVPREIEPGLPAWECPKSGGFWIPLSSYLAWRERHPETTPPVSAAGEPALQDDAPNRALICPESGRLLLRYRVGHGLPFHIDYSPATGGIWLDKGEWEALKSRGLHLALQLIFTPLYQRQLRSAEYAAKVEALRKLRSEEQVQSIEEIFREKIGTTDFAKVRQFGAWLVRHPKRQEICSYLLEHCE